MEYRGDIEIMEKKMETTTMGYIGIVGVILGFRIWDLGLRVQDFGSSRVYRALCGLLWESSRHPYVPVP